MAVLAFLVLLLGSACGAKIRAAEYIPQKSSRHGVHFVKQSLAASAAARKDVPPQEVLLHKNAPDVAAQETAVQQVALQQTASQQEAVLPEATTQQVDAALKELSPREEAILREVVQHVLKEAAPREANDPQIVARVDPSSVVFGYPAWKVAVFTCVIGALLTVVGFVLQKKGAANVGDEKVYVQIGDMKITGMWLVGLLVIVSDFPLVMFAYSLAPISLVMPLTSGLTVILNLVVAPLLLDESFFPWPDVPATMLVTAGIMLTTSCGSHEDTTHSVEELWSFFHTPELLGIMIMMSTVVVSCVVMMRTKDGMMAESAKEQANPRLGDVLLPAVVAAGVGLFTNIFCKALSVLVGSRTSVLEILPWAMFTVIPATVQINYVNKGMQMFPQAIFFPIYNSLLMVFVTLGGAIFFRELDTLKKTLHLFVSGLFLLTVGTGLFTLRPLKSSAPIAKEVA